MTKKRFVRGLWVCVGGVFLINAVGNIAEDLWGLTPRASFWLTFLLSSSFGWFVVGPVLDYFEKGLDKNS